MKKSLFIVWIFQMAIGIFLLVGYVRCVVKVFECNWEPIGKAEILYTGGLLTGLGGIIGWFDIEDK